MPYLHQWFQTTYSTFSLGCLDLHAARWKADFLVFLQNLLLHSVAQGQSWLFFFALFTNKLALFFPQIWPLSFLKRKSSHTVVLLKIPHWLSISVESELFHMNCPSLYVLISTSFLSHNYNVLSLMQCMLLLCQLWRK